MFHTKTNTSLPKLKASKQMQMIQKYPKFMLKYIRDRTNIVVQFAKKKKKNCKHLSVLYYRF